MLYAGGDELVHVWTANGDGRRVRRDRQRLHASTCIPAAEHLTFAALDDWRKEAAYTKGLRLVRNPARVSFRTADLPRRPEAGDRARPRLLGLERSAGAARPARLEDVDLTTAGCGGTSRC